MEEAILKFIQAELIGPDPTVPELGLHDELVLSELLDSMSAIRLIAYLESEYAVNVPASEMTVENFSTATAIGAFVRDLQQRPN